MNEIPKNLRTIFLLHFFIDALSGITMLLFTKPLLTLFQLSLENLVFVRTTGAALLGIGLVSLLAHRASRETYRQLLYLKLIWSGAAVVGILITLFETQNGALWLMLAIFGGFHVLWWYWVIRLKK